jgi:WD40 repeat protein
MRASQSPSFPRWLALPFLLATFFAAGGVAAQGQPGVGTTGGKTRHRAEVVAAFPHHLTINSVRFSVDGQFIVSGGEDKTVRLWSVATGRLIRLFRGHSGEVSDVSISRDGSKIASASYDSTLKIWDSASGQLLRTLTGHGGPVNSVSFSPDDLQVLSGSEDGTLALWRVANGERTATFRGHTKGVTCAVFSPDGQQVLSGGFDQTVRVWDASNGHLLRTLAGHADAVASVAYSPDGTLAVSGGADGNVYQWEVNSGQLHAQIRAEREGGAVHSVDYSSDGAHILIGVDAGTIQTELRDAKDGHLLGKFDAGPTMAAVFSPDASMVAQGSVFTDIASIDLFDVSTRQPIRTFGAQLKNWSGLSFSRDDSRLLSDGFLWNARSGKLLYALEDSGSGVLSPDGSLALVNSGDDFDVLETASGKVLRHFQEKDAQVSAMALSSDNSRMLWGDLNGGVKLWNITNGELIYLLGRHESSIKRVVFSPDGQHAASMSAKDVKIWDLSRRQPLGGFHSGSGDFEFRDGASFEFLPDGSAILAGNILIGGNDGRALHTFKCNKGYASGAKLMPGTQLLALRCNAANLLPSTESRPDFVWQIEIHNVRKGEHMRTFERPISREISSGEYAVSPDGKVLVSANENGAIEFWDTATGKLLKTYARRGGPINSMGFAASGTRLWVNGADGTIEVWSTKSDELLTTSAAVSADEWLSITSSGFFVSSNKPPEWVGVSYGLQSYSVEQFYDHLYRPDLVETLLSGDRKGNYKDAAYNLNLQKILESGPAPQLAQIAAERAGDTVRLSVRVTGAGGGVGRRIVWRVNGITQGNPTPDVLASAASPLASVVVTESLRLVAGQTNLVEVVAYNHAGLVAAPPLKITIDRFGATTTARPRMFVLAVGVDQYRMKEYRLAYAAYDARSIAKALEVVGSSLFAGVKARSLTDREVNEAGITGAIDAIAGEARPQDVFVLFLGGHGKSIAGRYYYFPQSLDFASGDTVERQGIGQDKWEAWLAKLPVQKSLLVIDTCEGDAFRGSRGTDAARQTAMAQLQRATGRNIIAAARDAAYEGYHGHGLLTYAILEALDKKASTAADDRIGVAALADYVGVRVPEMSRRSFGIVQNPTRKLSGSDFPIGIRQSVLLGPDDGAQIPKAPTHVLIRAELLREKPALNSPGGRTLQPGTQLRAVEFVGGWVIVAREGQRLGYVPAEALARIQ